MPDANIGGGGGKEVNDFGALEIFCLGDCVDSVLVKVGVDVARRHPHVVVRPRVRVVVIRPHLQPRRTAGNGQSRGGRSEATAEARG